MKIICLLKCGKNSKIQVVYTIAFTFAAYIQSWLSVFFYHIFLFLYKAGAFISSLFNNKTRKWLEGRKGIFEKLRKAIPADANIIWMHCSSLGEFEQGRPVLEKLRTHYPRYRILLTFFSPSGYEVQKNYTGADWVFYLPMDGWSNAKKFLEIVHPSLVIIVKYDLWYYYIKNIKEKGIPLLLISALFSRSKVLLYSSLKRKMFRCFTHFFVQDKASKALLEEKGYSNVTVAGDTRFDRVIEIAGNWESVPGINEFINRKKVIVAGSTWREDGIVLQKTFTLLNDPSLKLIIAPHELGEKNLAELEKLFPNSIRYSGLTANDSRLTTCLIIDNIGMLSRLYKYGDITFVGGGMTSYGVHNVLEAAVYYKPVIIGPYYQKYIEAIELVNVKGAIVIKNETELANCINNLLQNAHNCHDISGKAAGKYVKENAGAERKILQFIQENRLLTN